MEKFASTDTFVELLKNGQYKRIVMENDEDALASEEAFDEVLENFKANIARPGNFDYFTSRQTVS